MRRRLIIAGSVAVVLASFWLFASQSDSLPQPTQSALLGPTAKVSRQSMATWSSYGGKVEPRNPRMVMSRFRGNVTVIELAPEGAKVSKGEVLARLDASTTERDAVKLEKDYAVAESELSSFRNAKAPLEIKELSIKLAEARASLAAEENYLRASLQLAKEGLVSDHEIEQQKEKVAGIKTQLDKAELQLQLTREYLHPSEIKRAQAKLAAVENELRVAKEQVRESVISAPIDGIVVYMPLHIASEFRPVRIGDSLYPNQPFLMLHDMRDLVIRCELPEGELSKVQEGQQVFVQPLAYPDLRLRGAVESVSPMAQVSSGRPAWQKFFQVVVRLADVDPRLRPGMTVTTHVLSYFNPDVVSVPRTAVSWENGKPVVKVVSGSLRETRNVKLGGADERRYEIVDGLRPGDEVVTE
jgi:multidrug efflux pump subunit AcrA (membrane-fusion protein)